MNSLTMPRRGLYLLTPEEGIAPGTRWEDIPDTWVCPDCGVTKSDFEMMPL